MGLCQQPGLRRSRSVQRGPAAGGDQGLGEHGGPETASGARAKTAWSPLVGLRSTARRSGPSARSLPSGQPAGDWRRGALSAPPPHAVSPRPGPPRAPRDVGLRAVGLGGEPRRARAGAQPPPSRSLYLGLQPRWRPCQAGAGTAEVRGRHVLLVQPVVGCLPHSQVTIGRRQSEEGLTMRGEGAGDRRGREGVGNSAATRRHCCSAPRQPRVRWRACAPARGGA